jgi:hypothetical protein
MLSSGGRTPTGRRRLILKVIEKDPAMVAGLLSAA